MAHRPRASPADVALLLDARPARGWACARGVTGCSQLTDQLSTTSRVPSVAMSHPVAIVFVPRLDATTPVWDTARVSPVLLGARRPPHASLYPMAGSAAWATSGRSRLRAPTPAGTGPLRVALSAEVPGDFPQSEGVESAEHVSVCLLRSVSWRCPTCSSAPGRRYVDATTTRRQSRRRLGVRYVWV